MNASHVATPSVSPPRHGGGRLTFHNLLIAFCLIVLTLRLHTIYVGGGWQDRAQFFGEGELRPNLLDFVYNEIMVNYLILRVIAYRPNALVYAMIILSALAYFTRLPVTLLFFAILFAKQIKPRTKILMAGVAAAMSLLILYIRLGEGIFDSETSSIFYLTYPLIGLGRLWGLTPGYDITFYQYLSLFFKPLDAVLFVVDYVGNYSGELSTGRFIGIELLRFEYIQYLQGAYNAFGTILYPFIYIGGWIVGPFLFVLFIIFQHLQYRFVTQDPALSRRFLGLLLTTGILFSWTSPFVWLVPFLFAKVRGRSEEMPS
ncbi:hypothetical protein [Sphingomonas sp. BK235]|uniref:hypothetical protein n=1 Tax=Sphingomonas sp. BK235 TaxID=2512131 RepID=UPI0010512E54|nr:hypothetical protein [Sphingomonas sp. BK235]TCP29375.1 hypothetical protein EV292_11819 [Sphingomonas sp. BK235]